jgi:asparagine synthase (glutamine-hydrolysing)
MGGIVGVLNVDGRPLDDGVLGRLTSGLSFRGPDRQRWRKVDAHIGLGHTRLASTDLSGGVEQPFTLDGATWIVGDARVDARPDLLAALEAGQHGQVHEQAGDLELILRAYSRWGERCVEHLLGDFTFAVWDGPRQRLFCARDHLGVKPFYYAQCGAAIVFSNTLDCVRGHPAVSRELNDSAIADFLLFGVNQDATSTVFRDIRRLAPAHSMTWSNDQMDCRRYWTLPIDEPLFLKNADEYSERFAELLRASIRDRLRTDRIGVLMSGGIDSPTLAATALEVRRERSPGFALHAFTSVYDRLIPDEERYYAGLVARHLGIPIHYDVRDDETSLTQWSQIAVQTPEPVANPAAVAAGHEFFERAASTARVFLYGEGPDNALQYEWRPFISYLLSGRRVSALARSVMHDLAIHRRLPFWFSIKHSATVRREQDEWREQFPEWLDDSFAERYECRQRWDSSGQPPVSPHPIRPAAFVGFCRTLWPSWFEECDLAAARAHIELRHPYLDLRLLRYMLAVPAMPWCRNKLILRRSMRSSLPRQVLRRRKTALAGCADLKRIEAGGLPLLAPAPDLLRYVNPRKIPTVPKTAVELRSTLRPLGLNYWLDHLRSADRTDRPS